MLMCSVSNAGAGVRRRSRRRSVISLQCPARADSQSVYHHKCGNQRGNHVKYCPLGSLWPVTCSLRARLTSAGPVAQRLPISGHLSKRVRAWIWYRHSAPSGYQLLRSKAITRQ